MTSLRTVLLWLDEQPISKEAECWVLGDDMVEPVTDVTWNDQGNMYLWTAPPWNDPSPKPLHYSIVSAMLLEHYSGGGALQWATDPEYVYRGSHVVKPESAVFFLFLPQSIKLVESYSEKMEQRKKQAIDLTRKIEESQSWPTSM